MPTSLGLFYIDHTLSDRLRAECFRPGPTDGVPALSSAVHFDHNPIVYDLAGGG